MGRPGDPRNALQKNLKNSASGELLSAGGTWRNELLCGRANLGKATPFSRSWDGPDQTSSKSELFGPMSLQFSDPLPTHTTRIHTKIEK